MLTCGCHVHVCVEDDEEGVAVLNRIRVWLPVLTALTANSPFWQGADTGYASFRSQAWQRWPSAGPNELFADAADYHRLIDDVLATDTVLDAGMVYFDARLSEKWPTVEVRTADVAAAGRGRRHPRRPGPRAGRDRRPRGARRHARRRAVRSEVLRLAAWRAGRSGLTGDLVHPRTGRPAPAAEVVAALLDARPPGAGRRRRRAAGRRRRSRRCCAAAPAPTCSAASTGRPAATWRRRPRRGRRHRGEQEPTAQATASRAG